MNQYTAFAFIFIIFFVGASMFYRSIQFKKNTININKNSIKKINKWIYMNFSNEEVDSVVKETGLNLTGFRYQSIRFSLLFISLVSLIYNKLNGMDVRRNTILWILIFIISLPKRSIMGKKSPFLYIIDIINKSKHKKYDAEIYRCLSQLKNIALSKSGDKYSSDYIIGELTKYTLYTKPIFNRYLGYWHEAKYDEATRYFNDCIPTMNAQALSSLLLKIDNIKPSEFIKQIDIHQNESRERRKTESNNRKELKSNMIYGAALVTGVIILLNFLVVGIVIDTMASLEQISF